MVEQATKYYSQYLQNWAYDETFDLFKFMPYGYNAGDAVALNVDGDGHLQVDVLSTTASNTQYAEDIAHTTGDIGTMLLTVRQDDANKLTSDDGDYSPLTTSEHGCLNIDPQHYLSVDDCDSATGWSEINNDTDNLTTSTNHVWKTGSLSFDKIDGAGDSTIAGIEKTLGASVSVNKFIEEGGGFALGSVYVSSVADVDYIWFRMGTDNSNYNEWRVDSEVASIGWNNFRGALTAPNSSVGNGWNTGAVSYVAIGVSMNAEDDTLAEILVDSLFLNSGLQTSADITSQVSSSVSSPNVKVNGWLGSVDTGSGNLSSVGTLRVTNATDDVNLSAIKTSVEIMDDWDDSDQCKTKSYTERQTMVKKTVDFTASQTAQTIWDPTGGTKFVITSYVISCTTAGLITIFDETDDTTNRVAKHDLSANTSGNVVYPLPCISSTADNKLEYTTGTAVGYITVYGYEV